VLDLQIVYPLSLDDDMLFEIAKRTHNGVGRATRAQARQWYIDYGTSKDQELRDAIAAKKGIKPTHRAESESGITALDSL
jgi:hypothetical protein